MTRGALAWLVLIAGCSSELGPPEPGGAFDREVVVMCAPTTSAVGVRTSGGGRVAIELHRPGCASAGCEGSDRYAPGAWATIRTAGSDLLLEGCEPISAIGADRLRVVFRNDSGPPEQHEIGLVGDCLVAGACADADGG